MDAGSKVEWPSAVYYTWIKLCPRSEQDIDPQWRHWDVIWPGQSVAWWWTSQKAGGIYRTTWASQRPTERNGKKPATPMTYSTTHQIPSWNHKLASGGNGCHWCQDTKIPHNAWRIPHKVKHPETLQATYRRISYGLIHKPGWNKEQPGIWTDYMTEISVLCTEIVFLWIQEANSVSPHSCYSGK